MSYLLTGHDTTSSAISWTLYSLAKYPEYQERVRQEVDDLLSFREDESIKWYPLICFQANTLTRAQNREIIWWIYACYIGKI